jgi:arginase
MKLTIIKAPLVSEEFFSGVSLMADALIKAGISEALQAQVTASLEQSNWKPHRDEETKILNPVEVRDYSINLARAVEKEFDAGNFPIVLGGDCTILLGSMLAAKNRHKAGLFFIDGHADYYEPGISPSGETADMELGFVTGKGPDILANLENNKPLVEESNTVLFGFRDEDLIKQTGGADVRSSKIHCVSFDDTQYYGFSNTLEKSIKHINERVEKFWIHLDFDVLDDLLMPAVDYRMPRGLSAGELVNVLRRLMATGKVAGMSLAIFNPTLDWDGALAKRLVDYLKSGLIK